MVSGSLSFPPLDSVRTPVRKHGIAACSKFCFAKELSMTSLRQRMTEDMQVRNLALNTQTSYVQQVSLFARHFNKSPEQLGPEDIRTYQVYLTKKRRIWRPAPSSSPSRRCAFSIRSR